jgi:hypothetical protein
MVTSPVPVPTGKSFPEIVNACKPVTEQFAVVSVTLTFNVVGVVCCARTSPEQKASDAIKKVKDAKNFVVIKILLNIFLLCGLINNCKSVC